MRKPVTVREDTLLDKVVRLMESHNIWHLPVIRRGKVVGIVSRANLMRALASIHPTASKSSKNDAAIHNQILADIGTQSWFAGVLIDVVMRDGIAGVLGSNTDLAQR